MAALSGKKGLVEYKGGQVAYIRNWSMDVNTNMLDVTVWTTGTDQWRAMTPGLSGAAGSFSGFFVGSTVSTGQKNVRVNTLTPATGTIKLSMDKDGGESFTGSVYFDSMGHSADIDGTVDSNYSFVFNGAVTFSTTT
ncbi:MAG: hypothetical protein ACYTHJ_20855 [Planctomycetota bacterium]|jgi:hypothetical protein